MKRLNERIIVTLVLTLLFSVSFSSSALAWNPITHEYINSQTAMFYASPYQSYCLSGAIGPDMFFRSGTLVKKAHSPELGPGGNGAYDYYDQPNFAYLMLKVRGMGAAESRFFAYAMGWGI